MNYELAKKLRKAGFPQEGDGKPSWDIPNTPEELVYFPTLSELLEACGDGFFSLGRDGTGQWRAYIEKKLGEEYKTDLDKTPEEAVANLWLALNSKE